jgi:hypothetical protein
MLLRGQTPVCNSTVECREHLARSLFVVGEFGLTDYCYILSGGKSIQETKAFVPDVVQAIIRGVEVTHVVLNPFARRTHSFLCLTL